MNTAQLASHVDFAALALAFGVAVALAAAAVAAFLMAHTAAHRLAYRRQVRRDGQQLAVAVEQWLKDRTRKESR